MPAATSPIRLGILPRANNSSTITRTMIQCQMLNEPIPLSPQTLGQIRLPRDLPKSARTMTEIARPRQSSGEIFRPAQAAGKTKQYTRLRPKLRVVPAVGKGHGGSREDSGRERKSGG